LQLLDIKSNTGFYDAEASGVVCKNLDGTFSQAAVDNMGSPNGKKVKIARYVSPRTGADLQPQSESSHREDKAACQEGLMLKESSITDEGLTHNTVLAEKQNLAVNPSSFVYSLDSACLRKETLADEVLTSQICRAHGLRLAHDTPPNTKEDSKALQPGHCNSVCGLQANKSSLDSIVLEEDIAFFRQLNADNDRVCAFWEALKPGNGTSYLCTTLAGRRVWALLTSKNVILLFA
jgi:hypothetical protein